MTSYRFEQIAQQLRGDAAADDKTVDLLSMARAADRAVSYIILEAAADHARLRSHSDLDSTASVDQRLDGDEDFVHEAAGGSVSPASRSPHRRDLEA
ncbi:hypothetical protein [Frondihabitans sp. PAMC 28766]|uniref:hypothetical protein n=1 Tax=Frondihabitans sp. PAMC 28766 TaxID=1795630 RepID=UPI00138F693E|nr:hypothetical protein [Frondihabitans sp. PAMC 28766]